MQEKQAAFNQLIENTQFEEAIKLLKASPPENEADKEATLDMMQQVVDNFQPILDIHQHHPDLLSSADHKSYSQHLERLGVAVAKLRDVKVANFSEPFNICCTMVNNTSTLIGKINAKTVIRKDAITFTNQTRIFVENTLSDLRSNASSMAIKAEYIYKRISTAATINDKLALFEQLQAAQTEILTTISANKSIKASILAKAEYNIEDLIKANQQIATIITIARRLPENSPEQNTLVMHLNNIMHDANTNTSNKASLFVLFADFFDAGVTADTMRNWQLSIPNTFTELVLGASEYKVTILNNLQLEAFHRVHTGLDSAGFFSRQKKDIAYHADKINESLAGAKPLTAKEKKRLVGISGSDKKDSTFEKQVETLKKFVTVIIDTVEKAKYEAIIEKIETQIKTLQERNVNDPNLKVMISKLSIIVSTIGSSFEESKHIIRNNIITQANTNLDKL